MGIGALALSLMMLGSSLFLFPKGPPNALAWYLYGLSVIVLLLALPTAERRWTALDAAKAGGGFEYSRLTFASAASGTSVDAKKFR